MADLIELKVPDIGDFDSVEIIEVLVAEGDSINADQEVITIESDKAMMEIPSSLSGTIKEMKVKVGDKVSEGSVIALIESSDAGAEENEKPAEKAAESKPAEKEKPAAAESKPAPTPTPTVANPEPERTETLPYAPDTGSAKKPSHASPSVRQFARELGVPLAAVVGSGQKGRITKEDVQNFVKQVMNAPAPKAAEGTGIPSVPVINFEQFGEIESKELSRIKKISGKHLHACWLNIPHVTQFDEADITELEEFRQENKEMAAKKGVGLTPLVFIMKAVVACLKQYPEFNASLNKA